MTAFERKTNTKLLSRYQRTLALHRKNLAEALVALDRIRAERDAANLSPATHEPTHAIKRQITSIGAHIKYYAQLEQQYQDLLAR
jgi:hypothetical protein